MIKVKVKKSVMQGKGVFAIVDIKKNEIALDIDDSHIVKDISTLTEHQKEYECDWLDEKTILMQYPEKHINHSCNPNTFVKMIDGIRRVIALKNIKKEEEITYDYAINGYYDSDEPCKCGSKNCRGAISPNFFKLPRKRQLEYLPYLDDWFVKKFKNKIKRVMKKK